MPERVYLKTTAVHSSSLLVMANVKSEGPPCQKFVKAIFVENANRYAMFQGFIFIESLIVIYHSIEIAMRFVIYNTVHSSKLHTE